jgi:hypothetical protein
MVTDARFHEVVAVVLAKMNYSPTTQPPFKHSPFTSFSSLGPQVWERPDGDLAEEEAAPQSVMRTIAAG